jgi:hypothetical protein
VKAEAREGRRRKRAEEHVEDGATKRNDGIRVLAKS